ncbi:hypothetical protein PR048_000798 [Dryococelus australis]|uniref:Uncharacterized protein n=1 Tax=Dryococelus australis TaxID=614101 RepID=A0ABQ9IH13_9NEOP|nr:hypothetical protein PR048_000798 [Dryococelus australis]
MTKWGARPRRSNTGGARAFVLRSAPGDCSRIACDYSAVSPLAVTFPFATYQQFVVPPVSWHLFSAVHTRRTQQEPVTRVEPGETECTAATHERDRRGTHYTHAVTSPALLRLSGRCGDALEDSLFIKGRRVAEELPVTYSRRLSGLRNGASHKVPLCRHLPTRAPSRQPLHMAQPTPPSSPDPLPCLPNYRTSSAPDVIMGGLRGKVSAEIVFPRVFATDYARLLPGPAKTLSPLTPSFGHMALTTLCVESRVNDAKFHKSSPDGMGPRPEDDINKCHGVLGTCIMHTESQMVATVAERLACSPPTKAIRVQCSVGSLRIFACGNRAGRCYWSAGFLGDLPFPPSFHSGATPYSPQSPSSVLKSSMDIHGDSPPFLLQPFHKLSNGFWSRLTSPHPAIQFVPKMFYRVEVGALWRASSIGEHCCRRVQVLSLFRRQVDLDRIATQLLNKPLTPYNLIQLVQLLIHEPLTPQYLTQLAQPLVHEPLTPHYLIQLANVAD